MGLSRSLLPRRYVSLAPGSLLSSTRCSHFTDLKPYASGTTRRTGPPRLPEMYSPFNLSASGLFQDAQDRQCAREQLARIVIVVAVIEPSSDIGDRLRHPHQHAQRHAFPQAHAEWFAQVVARERLQELDPVRSTQLEKHFKVDGQWRFDDRVTVRVRANFEPPGLALEANLLSDVRWQGVDRKSTRLNSSHIPLSR